MDPFTEKDLIEELRSIALSLRNMDRKMDDLIRSVQDFGADISEGLDNGDEKEVETS